MSIIQSIPYPIYTNTNRDLLTGVIKGFRITNSTTSTDQVYNGSTWDNLTGSNTGDETATRIAAINHGTAEKTALLDADEITGQNSANSFSLIKTTWTNVKAFLKTYFDGLFAPLVMAANSIRVNNTASPANGTDLVIGASQLPLRLPTGNIIAGDITYRLSGKGILVAGNCTIIDAGITSNSWALVCVSTVGVSTSVPIKYTAPNGGTVPVGQMLFSTGQETDTCDFGYEIIL